MAKQVKLTAELREDIGTSKAKKLRWKGIVPGVFYGKGTENINLQLEEKALTKVLHTESGSNVIINLTIKSSKGEQEESVIPQAVQYDPMNDQVKHIDLRKINLKEKIITKVPVHLLGVAPGVKAGGILVHQLHDVELKCLPTDIPSYINIDISGLRDIGASIKVGEIEFPENIEPLHLHPEQVAVSVMAPKKEEEPVAAPLEEGAEPEVIGKGKAEGEEGAEGKALEEGKAEGKTEGKETEAKKTEGKKDESK